MIPSEIINKILSYNIHPVAELLKPLFINFSVSKTFFTMLDYFIHQRYCILGCFDCHKKFTQRMHINNVPRCCFKTILKYYYTLE